MSKQPTMPKPKVSKRGAIPPFFVMEVMRAAAEREAAGLEVLHMEVGQPSTGAPKGVVEAAAAAVAGTDPLGYTGALGIPPLRAAIARWYKDRYGVEVPERRVVVTTGSSGAFQLGFLAAFDPGDRVAMASPSYPAYRHTLTAAGVVPVELPTGPEHRFQPTVALLEALEEPVQGLIVASPANPTGTMLSREELTALSDWCRANGVRMVSDEIYHGLTYGTDAVTAAEVNDEALVVNSFSKYFSMTGWRLGWMIVPDDLLRSVECLAQNLFISAPTLSQVSAVAAFDCTEELDGHVARYARNRALLLEELPKAGFTKMAPADGAFYIYADVSDMTDDSEALAKRILEETGIACTPGIDFDPARGRRFLRFSFAGAEETIAEAARRLIAWRAGR
ncbi:1-aminocyclopropane-1-carboxylate deaminase [Azospirillum thiophilum]|uniref:Aminotransferase n=1 Tax=Azospirillum thiophilum TaxID=528244 RepID=A0AAC8ZTI8_9PROT|nr:aminotransferase class I/II-fold pyridoxal phosphate-dependent enzyme [Azospirillum thiophilum]ALG70719.1 1-aminocyclopropane-1-carboxylate deaminase [Azospirillum thiophilum]KJR65615.1 1-aminocyclopropane-1-carboxylate deaminase [Azospirillum thiophilum]